jgi:hypothetical protein
MGRFWNSGSGSKTRRENSRSSKWRGSPAPRKKRPSNARSAARARGAREGGGARKETAARKKAGASRGAEKGPLGENRRRAEGLGIAEKRGGAKRTGAALDARGTCARIIEASPQSSLQGESLIFRTLRLSVNAGIR